MALHHNASNMHLSLTHCTPSLLSCAESLTECPLTFIDPVTTYVRHGLTVNSVWKPPGLAFWCVSPSNHRELLLKGIRMRDVNLHPASCLYPQCAVNINRRPVALLWVRAGDFLPSSNICSWDFMHPCEGDCISRAFTQSFVPSLPHCWSVPTWGRCMHLHKSMDMHLSPELS